MNEITNKIKILCTDRNISIEKLAENAGLSLEQIELINKSDKIPSLSSLIKISRALGVRLGTFLDDNENFGPIVNRKSEMPIPATFSSHLSTDNSHIDFFSLAATKTGRHMEPFIINIHPTESTQVQRSTHEGEEFLFVLKGSITINYGLETITIKEGDSIYYDSIVEHVITSADDQTAQVLAVIYTPM